MRPLRKQGNVPFPDFSGEECNAALERDDCAESCAGVIHGHRAIKPQCDMAFRDLRLRALLPVLAGKPRPSVQELDAFGVARVPDGHALCDVPRDEHEEAGLLDLRPICGQVVGLNVRGAEACREELDHVRLAVVAESVLGARGQSGVHHAWARDVDVRHVSKCGG